MALVRNCIDVQIIGLFNQEIISYELTERLVFIQVVMMLNQLKENNIIQSMSRKEHCLDNAIIKNSF